LTHHDAITGTSTNDVMAYYGQMLSLAQENSRYVLSKSLEVISMRRWQIQSDVVRAQISGDVATDAGWPLLSDSVGNSFIIYNPLAWDRTDSLIELRFTLQAVPSDVCVRLQN
jgi:hypothetical protein